MSVYLITYDLNRPGQDYPSLYRTIKEELGIAWWHYLDSTWFIISDFSPLFIRDKLRQIVDNTDTVLVIKVFLPWASYNLSDEAASWLKTNII